MSLAQRAGWPVRVRQLVWTGEGRVQRGTCDLQKVFLNFSRELDQPLHVNKLPKDWERTTAKNKKGQ